MWVWLFVCFHGRRRTNMWPSERGRCQLLCLCRNPQFCFPNSPIAFSAVPPRHYNVYKDNKRGGTGNWELGSGSTRMFDGLRSLWITPWSCKYVMPLAMPKRMKHAIKGCKRPAMYISRHYSLLLAKRVPSAWKVPRAIRDESDTGTYSITKHRWEGCVQTP